MEIYLSKKFAGAVGPRELFAASQDAHMWVENEVWRGSRYDDIETVVRFNGYGREEMHSARRPNTRDPEIRATEYAATWDQWGVLLASLFRLDPDMKVGGYKRPYYDGVMDFNAQTNGRFVQIGGGWPVKFPADEHGDHRFEFEGIRFDNEIIHRCTRCTAAKIYAA